MNDKYVLDGKIPVKCDDLMTWARWFEDADRHVATTNVGGAKVSTVFLGLDHSCEWRGEATPILFETMVFGGPLDGEETRYSTWEEAEKGHKRMVEKVAGHHA